MPGALTEIERKILDFMVQYLRENTFQPSIREIGERFQIKSTKTVSEHLRALATKGYLERDPSRSRGVRILGEDLNAHSVSVPCYAELPRETGGLRENRAEAHLNLDRRMAGAKGSYFVRARGEELAALGVGEGDFLLVEPSGSEGAQPGDLVVAHVGEEPAIFRLVRNGSGLALRPGRRGEAPVVVDDGRSLDIRGRVVALFRRMDGSPVPMSPTAH